MNNSKPSSASRAPGAAKDLNAHEWSQAVLDELEHIQVPTPPIRDIGPVPFSDSTSYRSNTQAPQQPNRSTQESVEAKQQSGYNNNRNQGQLEMPQRPQAGTMESTATIDIVKQIPGGW